MRASSVRRLALLVFCALSRVAQGAAPVCRSFGNEAAEGPSVETLASAVSGSSIYVYKRAEIRAARFRGTAADGRNAQAPYNSAIDALRGELAGTPADPSRIEVVVYPASGFDSDFPSRLFANASLIVGIDDHAFASDENLGRAPLARPDLWWSKYPEIDRMKFLGAALIARIRTSHETARIKSVYRISSPDAVHGWIEFDDGPRAPPRRYAHLQAKIREDSPARQALQKWIEDRAIGRRVAVLSKAGMQAAQTDPSIRRLLHGIWSARRGLFYDFDSDYLVSAPDDGPRLPALVGGLVDAPGVVCPFGYGYIGRARGLDVYGYAD